MGRVDWVVNDMQVCVFCNSIDEAGGYARCYLQPVFGFTGGNHLRAVSMYITDQCLNGERVCRAVVVATA